MVSIRVKCFQRFQFFHRWFGFLVKWQQQYQNMLLALHQYLLQIYHLDIAKIIILMWFRKPTRIYGTSYSHINLKIYPKTFGRKQFSRITYASKRRSISKTILKIWETYFFTLIATDTDNTMEPNITLVLSFKSKHLDFESNFIVFAICIDDNRWISWTAVLNEKFRKFRKILNFNKMYNFGLE